MFTSLWVLEFKTFPRTDMDTEIASRAEFLVDNGDRTMCRTPDEFTHFSKLVADCLNGTDHPARTAVDTDIWTQCHVQHVPIACNRVCNWAIG